MGCMMAIAVIVIFGFFLMILAGSIAGLGIPPAIAVLLTIGIFGVIVYENSDKAKQKRLSSTSNNATGNAVQHSLANQQTKTKQSDPVVVDFGEYKEPLKSGGELVISLTSWYIQYFFPGPDRRYNWSYVKINASDVSSYCIAWENNYKEYLRLKDLTSKSSSVQKIGEKEMPIRVGAGLDGVFLQSYHMGLNTQEQIDQVISDYKYALNRIETIRYLLGNPNSRYEFNLRLLTVLKSYLVSKETDNINVHKN